MPVYNANKVRADLEKEIYEDLVAWHIEDAEAKAEIKKILDKKQDLPHFEYCTDDDVIAFFEAQFKKHPPKP